MKAKQVDSEKSEEDATKRQFSGLVSPGLNYLYKMLLEPTLKKHKLYVNNEFWVALSLTLFTALLFLKGIPCP